MSRKHEVTFSEHGRVSRAGLPARGGRILAMACALAVAPMVTGFPQVSAPAQAHPVKSQLRHVGFVRSSVAALRTADNATGSAVSSSGSADPISTARAAAVTPVQDVAGAVTVVGVTWPKGTTSARDTHQIRTLTGATWSQWQSLDAESGGPAAAEATAATGGTDPYVVTGASKYEVRSLSSGASVPAAATVQAVDPGTSGADDLRHAPGAASAATVKPTIYNRAEWGANESLRRATPSYGKIMVGFVHHTDGVNTYTADEVPAMIRGIYAYHVQSLKWDDIGYNFLVDRFGRIWEGRYGGMDKAVTGAQTLNFNAVSMGVSAIGNYDVAAVPQLITDAFKRIFAWKFSLTGIPATGTVLANGTNLPRVSGHRDAFATACPGRYLYARLAEIRTGTAAIMDAPATTPVPPEPPPPPPTTPVPPPAPPPPPPPVTPRPPVPPVVTPPVVRPPVVTPPAAPWAATRYTPYKKVVLRQGSKGSAVVVLQRGLRVTADGDFGPRTRLVLVAFQRQQRISANGIVSRLVWDRLEKRDHPLIAYRRLTLRQGSTGAVVVVTQRALRVRADGGFGPKTAAAVKVVQKIARLKQTGVVSGWTWVAIEKRMPR